MSLPSIAREIVAKRVAILAALPVAYAVLVGAGIKLPWTSQEVVSYVGAGITVVSIAIGVFWARSGVTPADPALTPTASHGAVLVPASRPGDTGADNGLT